MCKRRCIIISSYIMPKNIINKPGIYEFINVLWATYRNMTNNTIMLDYCNTKNIDLSLMAPLGLVLTKIKSNKNKIYFTRMNGSVKNKLIKAEFIGKDINSDKDYLGLVWDGDSCSSCSGVCGEYLKINNPHKISFYLFNYLFI